MSQLLDLLRYPVSMSPSLYFQLVVLLVALYSRAEASRLDICTLFSETRSNNTSAVLSAVDA